MNQRDGSAAVSAAGSGSVSPPVRETGTGTVPEPAGGTPALRHSWEAGQTSQMVAVFRNGLDKGILNAAAAPSPALTSAGWLAFSPVFAFTLTCIN